MTVHAKANVLLEINCASTWSDSTTIEQVRKQAIVDAENTIRKVVNAANTQLKIIGDIKVSIITFDAQ